MSGTTNPNIILGVRPNAVSGPDFGAMVANSQQLLQFRQQQDQVQKQNALMGIFKDPNSLDQTGNPTPETLQKVMSVDPNAGMRLRQNMLIGQQNKLRTEALSSDLMAKKMDMIGEAAAPVLEHYKEQVAAGVPEEQARREAQSLLIQANERLKGSGVFVEDDYKRFPTQFDPIQMEQVVAGTKQYQDWLKQRRDEEKQKATEKRWADIEYNRGTSLLHDSKGNLVIYRPSAPPGEQFKLQNGSNAPPDQVRDLMKVGAGGAGSAKSQENQRIADIARDDYERLLGHPVDPNNPQEVAEVMKRQQAAIDKHAADLAKAVTTARGEAGGGSVASQDLKATRDIVTEEWKQAHDGKPPDMNDPKQRADFEAAVQARTDKRKTDLVAARGAVTAKPTPVTINGKPGDAIWKPSPDGGHWYARDGTPIQGEVRLAGRPAAAGSTAAERQTRFEEMKAAQQQAGIYKDDTQVYRSLDRQMAEDKQTAISDDAARIAAQVALKTGHPPTWMGRSQASLTKFLDMYADEAKKQHLSASDIAANIAKFSGEMAEARTLGTASARIDFAAKELDVALPTAMEASQRVWRPGFKKLAELQQAVKGQTSDPDLLEFAQFNQQVMSAYSAAMQRGGTSTVHAMERAESLLSTATSQAGYMRQLDTLHKEVQTILYGTQAAKDHLRAEINGSPEITNPPVLTGVPRPEAAKPWKSGDPIPAGAVTDLKANPGTAAHFDDVFGKGEAAKILGQQPKPATQQRAVQATPQPMPTKAEDAIDGQVYNTGRGPARWDAKTKQFFPVQAQ